MDWGKAVAVYIDQHQLPRRSHWFLMLPVSHGVLSECFIEEQKPWKWRKCQTVKRAS